MFIVDGLREPMSLFAMIRATYARNSDGVLSAYRDNAAVIEGASATRFFPDPYTHRYLGDARARRHIDEGRDAQSSDRNILLFPVPPPAPAANIRR